MVLELEDAREERGEMVNRIQALSLTCRACVLLVFLALATT
jgi:hypothetical protein